MCPVPNGKSSTNIEGLALSASNPDTIKEQADMPNPSLQATADHQLKQIKAPVLAPQRGEVLLQIKATGICGYVLQHRSNMWLLS